MSVKARVARLERGLSRGGACPACPPPELLFHREEEPEPPLPPPCPRCGRPAEVFVIHERVVTTREEAQAALAEVRRAGVR